MPRLFPAASSQLNVAAQGAAFLEVFLVVLLCAPEGLGGDDLGDDGLGESLLRGEAGDGGLGGSFLLGRVEEDDAAVLRAPVGPLAVELGGIVEREERVEELLVGDLAGS